MTDKTFVYLDYAASAPMSRVALDAERAYEASPIAGANPNSLHTLGRLAAQALDGARRDLVRCLGGGFRPMDVAFTSGGTESNNLALYGMAEGMRARDRRRKEIVVSAFEHDSEVDVIPALKDRGFEVRQVRPNRAGVVTPEAVAKLVGPATALVSVMSANNEVGTVQPVGEIARVTHAAGALMHTDAVQAFGRIPLQLDDVDAVSIAAHKIGGPVGISALVMRGRTPFRAQTFGGGQEQGRRPGTQGGRDALAFAAAAKDVCGHTTSAVMGEDRLPGMVSIMVPGIDSETLVMQLDEAGFEVSAGSACSSGSLDASHVLLAMGIPRNQALGSLRISFDERVSEDDLMRFADALIAILDAKM